MKTIAILGIGAIGTVIANTLRSIPTNRLSYFSRTPKDFIKLIIDGNQIAFPIDLQLRNENKIKPDWLIICLKAYHFEGAKPLIASLISPNTKVAVIRNGVNLKGPILPFTSENNILECMIDCPTQMAEDGYYEQLRRPIISVRKNSLSFTFTKLFHQNEVHFNQVTDFKTVSWKKLIESSALGAILCLTGESCRVFENKNLVQLHQNLVKEGIQVALSDGAIIGEEFENELLLKLKNYPKTKGSSMLTDRLKGRPIEINAKNGVISNFAKINHIKTPLNDRICNLLSEMKDEEIKRFIQNSNTFKL